MMAFVRGVIAAAMSAGSIVYVCGSISTSTARAPVYWTAATVATNVKGTVITSSPGPTPAASSARCRPLVPELTATASPARQKLANSRSNAATSSPRMNCVLSSTRSTASSISALMLRY
jgi:hypothetical protein